MSETMATSPTARFESRRDPESERAPMRMQFADENIAPTGLQERRRSGLSSEATRNKLWKAKEEADSEEDGMGTADLMRRLAAAKEETRQSAMKLAVTQKQAIEEQARAAEAVATSRESLELNEYQEAMLLKLEDELEAAKAHAAKSSQSLKAAEDRLSKLGKDLAEAVAAQANLADELIVQEQKIQVFTVKLEEQTVCTTLGDSKAERLAHQLLSRSEELKDAVQSRDKAACEANEAFQKATNLQTELSAAVSKEAMLQQAVHALEQKASSATDSASQQRAIIQAMEEDMAESVTLVRSREEAAEEAHRQLQHAETQKADLQVSVHAGQEVVAALRASLEAAVAEVGEFEGRNHSSEWAVQHLAQQLEKEKQISAATAREAAGLEDVILRMQDEMDHRAEQAEVAEARTCRYRTQATALKERDGSRQVHLDVARRKTAEGLQREQGLQAEGRDLRFKLEAAVASSMRRETGGRDDIREENLSTGLHKLREHLEQAQAEVKLRSAESKELRDEVARLSGVAESSQQEAEQARFETQENVSELQAARKQMSDGRAEAGEVGRWEEGSGPVTSETDSNPGKQRQQLLVQREVRSPSAHVAKLGRCLQEERAKRIEAELTIESLQTELDEALKKGSPSTVRKRSGERAEGRRASGGKQVMSAVELELKQANAEIRRRNHEKRALEERMKGLEKSVDRWREFEKIARTQAQSKRQELELTTKRLADAVRESEKREGKEAALTEEVRRLEKEMQRWGRAKGHSVEEVECAKREGNKAKDALMGLELAVAAQRDRADKAETALMKEKTGRDTDRKEAEQVQARSEMQVELAKKDVAAMERKVVESGRGAREAVEENESLQRQAEETLSKAEQAREGRVREVRAADKEEKAALAEERDWLEKRVREKTERERILELKLVDAQGKLAMYEMKMRAAMGESTRMAKELEVASEELDALKREGGEEATKRELSQIGTNGKKRLSI